MKLDALDHPKVLHFASLLGITRPTAIGHLELLWACTAKIAPAGDIGKWPDGAIARACEWMGDPDAFVQALLQSRLLDAHPRHRVVVHDWQDHCPRYVRARVKALGQAFVSHTAPTAVLTVVATAVPPVVGNTMPSHVMPCHAKAKSAQSRAGDADGEGTAKAESPETPQAQGLDASAWARWLDYRRQIRKPLKPVSMPAAQRELAAFGSDQHAVVEQSIAQGWQGLFALKTAAKPSAQRMRTATEIAEDLERAAATAS